MFNFLKFDTSSLSPDQLEIFNLGLRGGNIQGTIRTSVISAVGSALILSVAKFEHDRIKKELKAYEVEL